MFSRKDELEKEDRMVYGDDTFILHHSYNTTTLQQHAMHTYCWMAFGLFVSAAVAFLMSVTNMTVYMFLKMPYMSLILLVAQLGVAVAFGARLFKMSPITAKVLFLLYAGLLGITLSTLAFAYDLGTIAVAFAITMVYFISLVVIGYTTKMNLLKFGTILMGGLFVFVICEIIMMIVGADIMTMGMSAVGLLLFTGITAYDAQKMKALYAQYQSDEIMLSKLSIYSAFDLYLDFINLFLYVLRFVGKKD